MNIEDSVGVCASPLTFDYRLFGRINVPNISLSNIHFDMTIEGEILEVPPMFGIAKGDLLLEFMQVSKALQEIVMTSTF